MKKISVKIANKELLVNFWKAKKEDPIGIFFIHHGMAEHIERYHTLANHLNFAGFHVVGHNHLGHGDNKENGQGIFAKLNGWEKVCKEATEVMNFFCNSYPNLPSYVFGHSMGAFVSLSVLKDFKNLEGVVLTGTFLPNKLELSLLKLIFLIERFIFRINKNSKLHAIIFKKLNSSFNNPRTQFDWLSNNFSNVDKYLYDRDCGFNCSNSLWLDFIYGSKQILSDKNYVGTEKDVKFLLACGEEDPVIKNGNGIIELKSFLEKRFNKISFIKYENMRHEIQNEKCAEEFFSHIVNYFRNV